jgi:hypothetical protein
MQPGERCVVVLGASPKPTRYSNHAVRLLLAAGYRVLPVHPRAERIHGSPVLGGLGEIGEPVDTLTVYLGAGRSLPLIADILAARPRRVILNPGAESPELERRLAEAHIPCLHACTLVLLGTGKF